MRTGVVESRIGGSPAPWRQASVLPLEGSRLAVVTVSDMTTAKSTFISEQYEVLGVLARTASDAALVTDETRGYKPLSHIWPLVRREGRLRTLIAMAPLRSEPPRLGVFAYVALGASDNELLFVCRLDAAPGPTWGELVANRDGGQDDMVVFERGQRGEPPIATFAWDASAGTYHGERHAEGPRARVLVDTSRRRTRDGPSRCPHRRNDQASRGGIPSRRAVIASPVEGDKRSPTALTSRSFCRLRFEAFELKHVIPVVLDSLPWRRSRRRLCSELQARRRVCEARVNRFCQWRLRLRSA